MSYLKSGARISTKLNVRDTDLSFRGLYYFFLQSQELKKLCLLNDFAFVAPLCKGLYTAFPWRPAACSRAGPGGDSAARAAGQSSAA